MDLFCVLLLTQNLLRHFVMRTQHLTLEKTHFGREHTPHFSFICMFASSNTRVLILCSGVKVLIMQNGTLVQLHPLQKLCNPAVNHSTFLDDPQ